MSEELPAYDSSDKMDYITIQLWNIVDTLAGVRDLKAKGYKVVSGPIHTTVYSYTELPRTLYSVVLAKEKK